MVKNIDFECEVENDDFMDNCLNFDTEFEPGSEEDTIGRDVICPYCGNEVETDQAYLGQGEFLCPYCGTRFDC